MKFSQLIAELVAAGVHAAYCTRITPTWLMVHVDLGQNERMALAKRLTKLIGDGKRLTVAPCD